MLEFEWDPRKESSNRKKHGVAFREAATVFRDILAITIFDPDHSEEEDRFIFGVPGHKPSPLGGIASAVLSSYGGRDHQRGGERG